MGHGRGGNSGLLWTALVLILFACVFGFFLFGK
jgi:hypothetical protein